MSESPMNIYPPTVVAAVTRRYSDAYVVAKAVDAFGATIKTVGIAIGVLFALGSLLAASKGGFGVLIGLMGLALAGAIATALYVLGSLASAQGQVLKATLDTAVNSSGFLSDRDRAGVMSLPFAAPASAGSAETSSTTVRTEWRCRCGQINPPTTGACLDCGVEEGAA
jgi:Mn2+/Fe2+ NRAMP family transporter